MSVFQILIGAILGALGVLSLGFVRKSGSLLAEDTYRQLKIRVIGRSDTEANESVIEKVEEVRAEKQKVKQELEEAESKISDYDKITRSLRSQNISRDDLVEHYWDPLHAILICFTNQKDAEGRKVRFIRQELSSRYELKQLTGDIYIIPPSHVPDELQNSRKARIGIKNLLDEEVYANYPGARSTICFAARVDLRDVYSRTDHPPEDRMHMITTIEEALALDDIFSKDSFSKALASENVNLSEIIEDGSLPFLASDYVSDGELDGIIQSENEIRDNLGDPSLKEIAYAIETSRMAEELSEIVADPNSVAESIIEEAQIWSRELYGEPNAADIQTTEPTVEAKSL